MKNVTDSFVSLGYWPSAGSFGFNTDILATNPINLSVVLGVLIFFGKGVCELHLRTINANIGMFGAMKEITD
uniref:ATP synthase CF0 B subunit n=1 Tax=Meliosma aff. cuneifolia Moore 333 TaxID=723415 RepID=A0A0X8HNG7_9MAGN|nr:ATP synthase CF0 B subunit [Meliosma aff. cuneifolia Moore 333]AMD08344.1 ATP synthase CF0 B subunit [Meliosma aff. cuneifolia Moore 333]WIL99210.1 ATP synthase CF0 B subunit [Meliosma myriantha var. discolor]